MTPLSGSLRHAWGRLALVVLATGALAVTSSPSSVAAAGPSTVGRHGVVPMLDTSGPDLATPSRPQGMGPLRYGGGNRGIGVTTGAPRVFLVFWGSQWGAASVGPGGTTLLSNDPSHAAPYLQSFLRGLGTGGETWSGVMTQYCQGVARGATSCPAGSAHVGYPTGGALAGVWADVARQAPQTASDSQMAAEAVAASRHFGNLSAASNR